MEINSTFYHFPKEKTVLGWKERTPAEFTFTFKMSRFVTHIKKFNGTKMRAKAFYNVASLLGEKLACILFQVPPSMHANEKNLEKIFSNLDSNYKNVLEFRHKSWFNPEIYKKLHGEKIAFCCVSAPRLPDDCIATTQFAYVRFHGSKQWYDYLYSKKELQQWAKRIKALNAKQVYCYFNNDFKAYAPRNCMQLQQLLQC